MQKVLIGLVVLIAAVLGYLYFVPGQQATQESLESQTATFRHPSSGLEFTYPVGPKGYVLDERQPVENTDGLVHTAILMPTAEYERMSTNPPIGGEGPAVISVQIFKNDRKQFPLQWAQEHQQYSSYNLKQGAESESVVGGANALRYMADGLYASEIVIVVHGEHLFVFTGQFMDQDSDLRRDFPTILETVRFVPTPGQMQGAAGKLNIGAICESALAYMTFPSGAQADAFVTACKEGKHPEVIERYKADMGITDDRAI